MKSFAAGRAQKFLPGLVAALLLLPPVHAAGGKDGAPPAAPLTERRKQKAAAEGERQALQQKLQSLKRDINQTEAARDNAADTLAASEDAISAANASLQELQAEQKQTEQKLKALDAQHKKLSTTVSAQQERLGKWLREQYVAGSEDRIKLLLSGDNPNRINRDLQYMSYLSQAQAKMLEELRQNLQAVEQNKAQAQQVRAELQEIAEEQQAQKDLLEQEKQRRAGLYAQLAKRLQSQRKEAGNLERDEQRLSGLVDKLGKIIEEQRKAEEAAEKRRLAALREQQLKEQKARAAREQQRAAQLRALAASRPGKNASASAAGNSANTDSEASGKSRNENRAVETNLAIKNELVPQPQVNSTAFTALRGQLRLPLRGTLIAKFGSKRGDGPSSKGVFIRAADGETVHAVAAGKVVFAEWLRGFGNLLIVDHGAQYMSIYGNNQTLLKRAGDTVKGGDPIANAGNSGGSEESGLYFELRHQGRAFDPLGWVK